MTTWFACASAALLLSLYNDRGFWRFLLSHPSAFDGSSLRSLFLSQLIPILSVGIGGLAAWGLGRIFLRRLRLDGGKASHQCVAFGLGLGLCALVVTALGVCGLLQREAFLIMILLAAAAASVEFWRSGFPRPRLELSAPAQRNILPLILLTYAAFHTLTTALAPPTSFDVTSYHLAIPKLYLRAGAIIELPWDFHSRWPHLMETFYSLPLAFGCDRAAALIHVLACAVLIVAVYCAAKDELGGEGALLAATLLACQPVLHYVMSDAHSDGALTLFHFLACLALWQWRKSDSLGWLAASACLSGLAASCKLQGLALTLALGAMAFRQRRKAGLQFLALAALICGPWYLKTWFEMGNPLWPFLSSIFSGRDHPALLAAELREFNGWIFPRDLPMLILRYGPLYFLLPFIGSGILAARKHPLPKFLGFLLFPAIPLALISCWSHEFWRFLLPALPALCLAAGWWASRLISAGGRRQAAAIGLLAAGMSPALGLSQSNELFFVAGLRSQLHPDAPSRENYLDRAADYYPFYFNVNALLSNQEKVLLFRETRGYYLDVPYQWYEIELENEVEANDWREPKPLLARLRELGVTHIVMHREDGWNGSFTTLPRWETALMEKLVAGHARLLLRQGAYSLYKILF